MSGEQQIEYTNRHRIEIYFIEKFNRLKLNFHKIWFIKGFCVYGFVHYFIINDELMY